jgi:outer membrane receptor protein involved in Fe transport
MKLTYRIPGTAVAIACTAALAAFGPASLLAQTAAPPAPAAATPAPSADDVVKMQQVEVESTVPIEEQILPTSRPFASVYGFDDDILSVPRNVTIVSTEQMAAIDIQDVTQFSKLTSSSFTDSDFGSPANPTIRGQPADFFTNGMRQHVGDNGDGMPVDFNSLESVNIVPGPATAVQGASAYVGGYVDMITKQPFFDGNRGFVSDTIGSYGTERWTLDDGGPINSKLAFRVSYSGEDSQGYWYNYLKQSTALYTALDYRPSDNYELFMTANAFIADYRENFGINRPTQALISSGLYQTGTNINGGTVATPADPQNALNVTGSDTIAFGPVVKIDYHEMAQGPLSHAHGQEYNWQAIQTFKVSPDFKVVNNSVYGYTKRDTYNSDGYSEEDDPTLFVDNRTELLFTLGKSEINAGLEERYQHVTDYTNFFFEPVNVWDLSSQTLNNDVAFQKAKAFAGTFGNVQVPGWPGRFDTKGTVNNDSNNSEQESVSPYVQSTWKLSDQWSAVVGARVDFMHIGDRDPLQIGTPGTSANIGLGEPNANVSLVYKITPAISTYGTVNFSENYTGDLADGGGFGLYTNANGTATLPRSLFSEESTLFEYGLKDSVADGKLFTTSDIFYQTRQNKPQGSPAIQYQYYGFETSANYQPNRAFFATFGYSWINGSLPASADPFQAYDTNQIPGGPPNPFANPQAYHLTGRLRAPGQPLDLFNALAQYTFPCGFGIEANALVTSPMNNDYWGYLVIPWQYEIDSSIFYKTKKYEVRLTVSNLTNEHNWEPSDATYGLEGIVPEPGIQGDVTVKFKF